MHLLTVESHLNNKLALTMLKNILIKIRCRMTAAKPHLNTKLALTNLKKGARRQVQPNQRSS